MKTRASQTIVVASLGCLAALVVCSGAAAAGGLVEAPAAGANLAPGAVPARAPAAGAPAPGAVPPAGPAPSPAGRTPGGWKVIDLGEVVRGALVTAVFEVPNGGVEPLRILDVRADCPCLKVTFDASIAPGGTGKVSAVLDTGSLSGPQERLIVLTTSDPAGPSRILRLKVNVAGSIEVLPRSYLSFPNYPSWGFEAKLLIRATGSDRAALKLAEPATSVPWLIARARKVEKAEPLPEGLPAAAPGDWILDVSVTDAAPVGQSRQEVRLRTGLATQPELTLPVGVAIQKALQADPPSLVLNVPPGSREAMALFTVIVRPGAALDPAKPAGAATGGDQGGKGAAGPGADTAVRSAGTVQAFASPEPFSVTLEPAGERRYRAVVGWKGADAKAARAGSVVLTLGGRRSPSPSAWWTTRPILRRKPRRLRPPPRERGPGNRPPRRPGPSPRKSHRSDRPLRPGRRPERSRALPSNSDVACPVRVLTFPGPISGDNRHVRFHRGHRSRLGRPGDLRRPAGDPAPGPGRRRDHHLRRRTSTSRRGRGSSVRSSPPRTSNG